MPKELLGYLCKGRVGGRGCNGDGSLSSSYGLQGRALRRDEYMIG